MPIVYLILVIIAIYVVIYIVAGIALLLFWGAVGVLGIGAVFGGGVSLKNYAESFVDNVKLEKPVP